MDHPVKVIMISCHPIEYSHKYNRTCGLCKKISFSTAEQGNYLWSLGLPPIRLVKIICQALFIMEAAYSILQLVLARCNDPDAWHHVLTNTLPDLDHGRGLLDDLLELVHDVFVRVVDPRPRYDYASQLHDNDTFGKFDGVN